MVIKVKEVPIKVYNSIRKVEQYYILLRRVYKIISLELKDASEELTLQMAVKAINNSAGPDRLVPILLVFSAYLRMTNDSLLSPSII
jgi:hypothetical protein